MLDRLAWSDHFESFLAQKCALPYTARGDTWHATPHPISLVLAQKCAHPPLLTRPPRRRTAYYSRSRVRMAVEVRLVYMCARGSKPTTYKRVPKRPGRGGAAAARAPIGMAMGGRQAGRRRAPRRVDACAGASAAQRHVQAGASESHARRAGLPPSRLAPAVPRGREVRARANAWAGPAAHRGSRRLAPAAARHACQRAARHQLPPASAPAADHAATLWPVLLLLHWSRGARSAPGGRCTRPQLTGRAARARHS